MQILHIIVNVISLIIIVGAAIWLGWWTLKRSDDPPALIFKWLFTAFMMWVLIHYAVPGFKEGGFAAIGGLMLACIWGISMTLTWRHSIAELIANPIASLYDGGKEQIEPKPYYSIAHAQRKKSKPLEAIIAVREQLAKFPNDYEGVMLLAAIQAEDTKDLMSAEMTLNAFCEWEKAPPKQIAGALMQLADWQIKILNDVDSAKATLRRIIERFPDSELSAAAAQRLAHFGGTEEILAAARDRKAVFVPEGVKSLGLRDSIRHIVPEETSPERMAEELTKHLETHPLDYDARENLAVIYGRHYQRLDLAAEQLNQLIAQHVGSPKKVAHWLNLFADLQIRAGSEFEQVAPTLEKIIEMFPDLPVADLARSRLNYLKLEIHGKKDSPDNKKLGEYEQNIGLKYGQAYGSPKT